MAVGFDAKKIGKLWIAVLLLRSVAIAADSRHQITVFVNNSAGTSVSVLRQAEAEAERVLSAAGIDVGWVNCQNASAGDNECGLVPGVNQLMLHIVMDGKTSSDSVFGEAFLAEDGSGKYCDVFLGRIESAHLDAGTNVAQLLGAVAAHELGHLLLGSHSHSPTGIMVPLWQKESLRRIGMGMMFFTREQSRLMRSRIGDAENLRASLAGSQHRRSADSSYTLGKKEAFWAGGFAFAGFLL